MKKETVFYKGTKTVDVDLQLDDLVKTVKNKTKLHISVDGRYLDFLKENDINVSRTVNRVLQKLYLEGTRHNRKSA